MSNSNPKQLVSLPHAGESAFSYCEHIALSHGWYSANALLKGCGKKPIKNWFSDECVVKKAVQIHIEPFANKETVKYEDFAFSDESVPRLRVCTECISESKPHLSIHQVPYITHCTAHSTLLIDQCPKCKRALDTSLHSYCRNCESPLYLSFLDTHGYFKFATAQREPREFLQKLASLAEKLIRPWDLIQERPDWSKLTNNEIAISLSCAFLFMIDPHGYPKFKHALFMKHRGNSTLLKPLLSQKLEELRVVTSECLKACSTKIEYCHHSFIPKELDRLLSFSGKLISPKRLVISGNEEKALQQHCTGSQMSKVFGIDSPTLQKLINMDLFIPISNTRVLSHALFCFRSTTQRINTQLPPFHFGMSGDYICLNHLSERALKSYGVSKGDIFFSVLTGEINGKIDLHQKMQGSRIFLQSSSLMDHLVSRPVINDHLPISELSEILMVPQDVLENLIINTEHLFFAKYQKCGKNLIDRATAEDFIRRYTSINRISWLFKKTPSEVTKQLQAACDDSSMLSIFSPSDKKHYSFIKINQCSKRNLNSIFDTFPKRLLQKKWYLRRNVSIIDGIEECYPYLDVDMDHSV